MGTFIDSTDLTPFASIEPAKADAMIEDAEAMLLLVAPCVTATDFTQAAVVKAVLRGAILRWNDSGSGALSAQGAGPFSQTLDTRQPRKSMFWPSEIEQLQGLCSDTSSVYTTSLAGPDPDPSTVMSDCTGWSWGWPY